MMMMMMMMMKTDWSGGAMGRAMKVVIDSVVSCKGIALVTYTIIHVYFIINCCCLTL